MIKITPISEIVKNVFSKIENEKTVTKEDVENHWKEVVGEQAFKHSRPVTLRKGTLTVLIDTSGWMQALSLQKRKTLKGLQRIFGKDRISEIQFKIGEF